jgi:hypothetical protein
VVRDPKLQGMSKGTNAISSQNCIKKMLDEGERKDMMQELFKQNQAQMEKAFNFAMARPSANLGAFPMDFYTDGENRCTLCAKFIDHNHIGSRNHVEKATLVMELDTLLGRTIFPRVPFQGMPDPLNHQHIYEHWGCETDQMAKRGLMRLRQFGIRCGKEHIPGELIEGATLGMINYSVHQKKYSGGLSKFVPWPVIADSGDHREMSDDTSSAGGGDMAWWPVLSLHFVPCSATQFVASWGVQVNGCWIVCVYQLFDLPSSAWLGTWVTTGDSSSGGGSSGSGVWRDPSVAPSRSSRD